jgi:hypothetical protein
MRTVDYTYLRVDLDGEMSKPLRDCGRGPNIRLVLRDGYPCPAGQHAAAITLVPSQARELADTLLKLSEQTEPDRSRP